MPQRYEDPSNDSPMDVRDFVKATKHDVAATLSREDPTLATRFRHMVDYAEALSFRHGFMWGAILATLTVLIILLVTRR